MYRRRFVFAKEEKIGNTIDIYFVLNFKNPTVFRKSEIGLGPRHDKTAEDPANYRQ